jgi:2'-hydroxyisoflavone reductase
VGRHIVRSAVQQGHDVTVFNRGRIRLDITEHCTQLTGDRRSGDLSQLARGRWDAVIDVCGYTAAEVSRMAMVLRSRVGHYCFISTGAVYADMSQRISEDSPLLAPFTAVPDEQDLISHYAELKVACEQELRRAVGSSLSIVRLGVVVGAGDYTDRLTYWVRRVSRGGTVLGPPRAQQPLQLLHARDLAESVLAIVSAAASMCVNLAGPEITFADLMAACVAASGSDAQVVWGGPEDLPLATAANGSHDGGYQMTSKTGVTGAGSHQPLVETCLEVLTWDAARGRPPLKVGIASEEAERALISQLST